MTDTCILIADDDRDIRELVTFKLTQAGYAVVSAEDGAQAWQLLQQEKIDLAVLDVMMPHQSGIEVCRALREAEATREVPVILLTAKAQEGDVESGLAAGADEYVTKPFSLRELVTRIAALLPRGR